MKKILLFLLLAVNLTAFSQATLSSFGVYLGSNLDSVRVAGILKSGSVWVNRTFWAIDIVKNRLKISDTANMLTPYATKQYVINTTYTQAQANALFAAIGHTHSFASLTSKPTTLSGYGITDAAPASHTHSGADIVSGTVADARLSSNVTLQGNTFNAANKLVKLDGAGKLPAIDGSQLTNLPSGGGGVINGNLPIIVLTQYGVIASPSFNAGARIQAIIDSLEAINAKAQLYLPHGDYYAWLTTKATNYSTARITIHKSGIQLVGENQWTTVIHFRGTGNTDPLTHWDTFNDTSHGFVPYDAWVGVRSPGIQINASSDGVNGIVISNLGLDGGTGWTGHYNYPIVDTIGGDGWDPSNQAIQFQEAHYTVGTVISHCNITNWRGELMWSGSVGHRQGLIEYNNLSGTNGSAISLSAFDGEIAHNNVSFAVNGVENYPGTPYTKITYNIHDNVIHDIKGIDANTGDTSKGNGIVIGGAVINSIDSMQGQLHNNIYSKIKEAAIEVIRSTRNLKISQESMKDVGYGINLQPYSGTISDISISDITAVAEDWNVTYGVYVQGNATPMKNIDISDVKVYTTDKGKQNGKSVFIGIGFLGCDSSVYLHNCRIEATHGIDGNTVGSNVHYPVCYGNIYTNPSSNDYTISVGSSGSLNVGGMDEQRILNSPDASITLDVVYPWTKLLKGSRFRLVNLSANTKLRLNTGTNYQLTTAITLNQNDIVELEWTGSKMRILSSTTQW